MFETLFGWQLVWTQLSYFIPVWYIFFLKLRIYFHQNWPQHKFTVFIYSWKIKICIDFWVESLFTLRGFFFFFFFEMQDKSPKQNRAGDRQPLLSSTVEAWTAWRTSAHLFLPEAISISFPSISSSSLHQ